MNRLSRLLISLAILAVLVSSSLIPAYAQEIPAAPTDGYIYVYDPANVISDEDEVAIAEGNDALFALTGAQVVIAAVQNTGDIEIKNFAEDMFNQWRIGSKERNNGILLLMSIDDDSYWLIQGAGLDDMFSSDRLRSFLNDNLEPEFAQKNYSAGAVKLFTAMSEALAYNYGVDLSSWDEETYNFTGRNVKNDGFAKFILYAAIVVIVLLLLIVVVKIIRNRIARARYRRRRPRRPAHPQYRGPSHARPMAHYPPRPDRRPPNQQSYNPNRRPPQTDRRIQQDPRMMQNRQQGNRYGSGQNPNNYR